MAREQHVLSTHRTRAWTLVAALVLTGASMRTAVTSVGAALDDVQRGLHIGSAMAGLVTTLPVVVFAGIGALTPAVAHRVGAHALVVASLTVMSAGLVARAVVSSVWLFLLLSVLALAGGAVTNVLMPSLVKQHFPDRIGQMTAVYTTALAVGLTAAAGLSVPIADAAGGSGGWRWGIGAWSVFSALAVLPWLPTLRGDRPEPGTPRAAITARHLFRSPTAWALTVLFAFQSFQAYVSFGWFAKLLHAHGISHSAAGAYVALLAAVSIPVSMVVPNVRPSRHRAVLVGLALCSVTAYVGIGLAPVGGAWLWMVLAGVGGGAFPVALTLIGLRARTAETTAALSAFTQSIGYIIAGSGPLLFGVLYGSTHSWAWPLATLYVALALSVCGGWLAARPCYVDDELAESVA